MREVERVLERANLIVQRVETENDIGRDAYVEIVEGADVTGSVVAVQVKSGASFFHNKQWVVPGSVEDFTLWRDSTVPMFGIVHDPVDDHLRWVELSAAAIEWELTSEPNVFHPTVIKGPYGKRAVVVPVENRLDLDVAPFLKAAMTATQRASGLPVQQLLSGEREAVERAIGDCYAIGRGDSTPFLLLSALLSRLPSETRRLAVSALAMATNHPDIGWTSDNWIPSTIKTRLASSCRWTNDDVAVLLGLVDEDNGMQRGSFGQNVFHVLELDTEVDHRLKWVATDERHEERIRFWAAAILLYHAGEGAPQVLRQLMDDAPCSLRGTMFAELVTFVDEYGFLSLF